MCSPTDERELVPDPTVIPLVLEVENAPPALRLGERAQELVVRAPLLALLLDDNFSEGAVDREDEKLGLGGAPVLELLIGSKTFGTDGDTGGLRVNAARRGWRESAVVIARAAREVSKWRTMAVERSGGGTLGMKR